MCGWGEVAQTPKNMKSVSIIINRQNVGTAHIVQYCERQLIKKTAKKE